MHYSPIRHRRQIRFFVFLLVFASIICFAFPALCEYARVTTPKGPVKMRKQANKKAKLVCEIPNKTVLEIDEVGEEWCLLTYNGKTGYVMTQYLTMQSQTDSDSVQIVLSNDHPVVGEEIGITVSCPDANAYRYTISPAEKGYTSSPVPYSQTYFRPRQAGLYSLTVTAYDGKTKLKESEAFFRVEDGLATSDVPNDDGLIIYSQRDGWWLGQKYRYSNLSKSGCAIFTLSHALQLMGKTGEEITPSALALKFGYCLVDGGTLNETLIGGAAKQFSFKTRSKLIKDRNTIIQRFEQGALFTFSIVSGHIGLAAGLNEDGTMVRIIDSAPAVTLERIKNSHMYYPDENGNLFRVNAMTDIPGIKYYFETDSFNGLSYYLDLNYVAKRGVRLIQP